jgi:hypothetical protein
MQLQNSKITYIMILFFTCFAFFNFLIYLLEIGFLN